MIKTEISKIRFGSTGDKVTVVGLGGEGILRTTGNNKKAAAIIEKAFDEGIGYFDSARVYQDSELYYGAQWMQKPGKRNEVFQTSKSASRDKEGALFDLKSTLKRLSTSYLDLWQIHDVRNERDLKKIESPGGALEAFIEAKEAGLVRYIGVTGHHDPAVLAKAIERWPVDSVLLPANPIEEIIGGFLTETIDAAEKKGIAVIGMKILGASHYILPQRGITADVLIKYAMSHRIDVAIVGCSTPEEVKTLAEVGKNSSGLTLDERKEIMEIYRPYSEKMAYYRGVL